MINTQPIIRIGRPKIKFWFHSKPSKIVEIVNATIGIITPIYPALAEPMRSNKLKYK